MTTQSPPSFQQIAHLFSETLQPEASKRTSAERQLMQWLSDAHTCNAFTMQLFQFLHHSIMLQHGHTEHMQLSIQLACAIYLKNHVRKNWRATDDEQEEDELSHFDDNKLQIARDVKAVMKEKMIECIVYANHTIRYVCVCA